MDARGIPIISPDTVKDHAKLYRYLTLTRDQLARLAAEVRTGQRPDGLFVDLAAIRTALQAGGSHPLNLEQLNGRLAEPQLAGLLIVASEPPASAYSPGTLMVLTGSPDTFKYCKAGVPNTWQTITMAAAAHNLLSTSHGDSLAASVVRGAMIVGNSTPAWALVTLGAAKAGWRVNAAGTDPEWSALVAMEDVANTFTEPQTFSPGAGTAITVTTGGIDIDAGGLNVDAGGVLINAGTFEAGDAVVLSGAVSVDNTGSPHTVAADEFLILVVTSGGVVTINMPASVTTGRQIVVKDSTGNAAANNITVSGNGNNIDGAASLTINTAYGKLWIVGMGSTWGTV